MHIVDRDLHPAAWWIWAAAMAVAVTRTTHIAYAVASIVVCALLVERFRGDQPWSRAFNVAMAVAGVVLVLRITIGLLFAVPGAGTTLFSMPRIQLPAWFAGITLGGPVTTQRLGSVLSEGIVIVALIAAIGVATALTNPRRLLRILPGAVHEAGVAVVVATTFTPQLVMSVRRVQEARRLRGHDLSGLRGLRGLARPVVEDALDRAMTLAAAMESRGYGAGSGPKRAAHGIYLLAVVALAIGGYGMLAYGITSMAALACFVLGSAFAFLGLHLAGKSNPRTIYRPDTWRSAEWSVALPGIATAALVTLMPWVSLRPSYANTLLPPVEPLAALTFLLPLLPMALIQRINR